MGAVLVTLCSCLRSAAVLGGRGFLGLMPSSPQTIAESRCQQAVPSVRDRRILVAEERQPVFALTCGRRGGALAALSFGTWMSGSRGARAEVAAGVKAQVFAAGESLRRLQASLKDWKGTSADAGTLLKGALGGTSETPITINVAAGESLGIEAEGLTVTKFFRADSGWRFGDVIESVNGMAVEDIEDLKKKLKEIGNKPIKVGAKRLFETPFPTLERAFRRVYEDSDAPLPEVEEVMKVFSRLTLNAALAADDILSLDDLRPDLNLMVTETAKFEAVLLGTAAKSKVQADASEGDMSDLFG